MEKNCLSNFFFKFYLKHIFFQALDLSRNLLNGFDEEQVKLLYQIEDVKLASNPLICDRCHMGPLIDIARTVCIIW